MEASKKFFIIMALFLVFMLGMIPGAIIPKSYDECDELKENMTDCEIQLDYRVAGLKYVKTQFEACDYVLMYFDNKYNFKEWMNTWSNDTVDEFLEGYISERDFWESIVYERLKDVPDLRESYKEVN